MMPDETAPTPIEVNASPVQDQLWAGIRQIAPALMAFLIGRNLIQNDTAILLGVVGGIAWPIIAGQLKTRRRAVDLATIANDKRVPDEVAVIRK
jgi:hypothetical protein